jgi:hypothetical protein
LGFDPINITSNLKVPFVYGGDGQIKEVVAGSASLAGSTKALTQFMQFYLILGSNGPRFANGPGGFGFSGTTPGAYAQAHSLPSGIDWAYAINTRDWAPYTGNTPPDVLAGKIGDTINSIPLLR